MTNRFPTAFDGSNEHLSLERLLKPLWGLGGLRAEWLGSFKHQDQTYQLPRFSFRGPNSSDPIRVGLFGAIHGDEPSGALALIKFLQELAEDPRLAENFHLEVYPVCNPSGFEDGTRHSRRGYDLNREFWSASTEAEVQILEHELRTQHFNGIIQLHADDTSEGIYGFVRGHTLTENLLRPALREAGRILPRNVDATIDGFAARDGIIRDHYEGVLTTPLQMDALPFEIIFETPQLAPLDLQVEALVIALRTILSEYRRLVSFAANI
jgi:protein MpaA